MDMKYRNKKPEASNETPSLSTFFNRKVYRHLERVQDDEKAIINLWNGKIKYGRVNEFSKPVYPKEKYLRVVLPELTKGKVKLLNFVADAFEEFREFWLEFSGCPDESNIKEMKPIKGWKNVNVMYSAHLERIYTDFYSNFILGTDQNRKLTDFYSFLRLFDTYSSRKAYRVPFTRSKFITTYRATPHISGLVVEIAREKHSDDVEKFEGYIEDPKFTFFKNAAIRFGFFVDKNAPWRLIADIYSPAMKPYMDRYDITPEKLFDEYYFFAEMRDIDLLKTLLFNFYNSFVTTYPVFRVPHGGLVERPYMMAEELNQLPSRLWYDLMLKIKRMEGRGSPFPDTQFDIILKKALDKEKFLDSEEAIRYINIVTK